MHKTWLEVLVGAIEIDPLEEDAMAMEVEIDGTPETLDKCDRPWLDVGSRTASCDGSVHIILPDRGTDDRMDLRGEILGRGHPIPQGDRHRHDPLAYWHPGDDPRNQVGGGLGHAPTGTRRTKPPALAAEWEQQLLVARVTAQPEETMRQDAALQVVVQCTLHIGGQAFRIGIGVKGGEKGLQMVGNDVIEHGGARITWHIRGW